MRFHKFLFAILFSVPTLLRAAATLDFETSADLKTWNKVPPAELQFTANGSLVLRNGAPQNFYRLRVSNGQNSGYLQVISLTEAPASAVQIANEFLAQHLASAAQEPPADFEWPADAQLAPFCYPVYDPAFEGGLKPAYLEFKVIRKAGEVPVTNALGMSPPLEGDPKSAGYILIGLNQGDAPVPEFSDRGLTKIERLLGNLLGEAQSVKPFRFDPALIIAENEKGAPVGSLGSAPFQIDPAILEFAGKEIAGAADNAGDQTPVPPVIPIKGYDTYDQFKKDFVNDPVNQFIRKQRANVVKPKWAVVNGATPPTIKLTLRQPQTVLADQTITTATVDDPKLVTVSLKPGSPGVTLTAIATGATILRVQFGDGSADQYILNIPAGSPPGAPAADWTPWRYYDAGTWGDQRRYQQFDRDPQMCTGGASGCGPTAWAMLYGWWDLKGSRRLIGNVSLADAPLYNNSAVLDCTRYVFNRVGPLCVSGQAATMPWNMSEGYRWANARGAGFSISWNWGVPYLSPGVRDKARDSIMAGRPSIVGLGFYSHYPLAYGYATRDYVFIGITWDTAHYFKCNMGWGGSSPEWQDGSSFWFATNGRYF